MKPPMQKKLYFYVNQQNDLKTNSINNNRSKLRTGTSVAGIF